MLKLKKLIAVVLCAAMLALLPVVEVLADAVEEQTSSTQTELSAPSQEPAQQPLVLTEETSPLPSAQTTDPAPTGSPEPKASAAATETAGAEETVAPTPVAVTEIRIAGEMLLQIGEQKAFSVTVLPENAADKTVIWKSSDKTVACVSADGVVSALKPGKANIIASTADGAVSGAVELTVAAPAAVSVENVPEKLRIGVGQSIILTWKVLPPEADQRVTFLSSDDAVAAVSAEGRITGKSEGICIITVETPNGISGYCTVTVADAPSEIKLPAGTISLGFDAACGMGDTYRLRPQIAGGTAAEFTYKSSNEGAATVSPSGLITAKGLGETTITVTAHNGVSASCKVVVGRAPEEIWLGSVIRLSVGDTIRPAIELRPAGSVAQLRCYSSNTHVMTVAEDGTITAVAPGAATFTVEAFNGVKLTRTVRVTLAPAKVVAAYDGVTVGVGQKLPIEAWIEPAAARSKLTYSSSRKSVATVDGNGIVTGVKAGTATITISAFNGKKDTVKVTVKKAPAGVRLNKTALTLGWDAAREKGETFRLVPELSSGSAGNCEFSSSDPWVVDVHPYTGVVTARGVGRATITVTTFNGHTARCAVEVIELPETIRVPADMMIGTGERVTPEIEVLMVSGEPFEGRYTITSSNSSVVSVRGTDLVAGAKAGYATITVRVHSREAKFNVEVVKYSSLYPSKVFAHRGASAYAVDNTIESFKLAQEMGADGVELDVRKTKDGVLVCVHDAVLTIDGVEYVIADMTLAELQALEVDGCRVPTLDEALDYIKGTGMSVQVEMKSDGIGAECAQAVLDKGLSDRAIYISFSLAALEEVKSADNTAKLGFVFNTVTFDVEEIARQYDLHVMLPKAKIVTQTLVNQIHGAGLRVGTWTVNTEAEIARVAGLGVDYIATDKPDLAGSVLR